MRKTSEVLQRAKDSFMEELKTKKTLMLLIDPVLHVLRAAEGDADLANKALSFLSPHQDRFDRAIEAAKKEEA